MINATKPTIAEVEAVFEFIEYFANLHDDGILDQEGPSYIQQKFEPIAHCWRRVLFAAAPMGSIVAQPGSPAMVLGGQSRG